MFLVTPDLSFSGRHSSSVATADHASVATAAAASLCWLALVLEKVRLEIVPITGPPVAEGALVRVVIVMATCTT